MKQMKWFLSILLVLVLTGCASSSSGGMGESQAAQMKAVEKKKEESKKKAEETGSAATTKEEPKVTEQKNEAQPSTSSPTTAQPKKEEGSGTPQPTPASPPASTPAPSPPPPKQEVNGVTISIVGDKELGTILPTTDVEIDKDSTVFTVLAKITRSKKIQMEYMGSAETIYVKGIDNLYEKDITPESGWMYRVNGVFPKYSAGIYHLKKGDKIEWVYTLDLGRDVGGYME